MPDESHYVANIQQPDYYLINHAPVNPYNVPKIKLNCLKIHDFSVAALLRNDRERVAALL